MAAAKRRQGAAVKSGFSFFQAVLLLERMHYGRKKVGEVPLPKDETIRFAARKGFRFPASDVSGLEEDEGRKKMEVTFMGLIGPSGVLPDWYHELVLGRERASDFAIGEFFDLFHHRLISLFYRAWKRNRVAAGKEKGNTDKFSVHLFHLLGLGAKPPSVKELENSILFYSGRLSRQIPTAATIAAVVQHHLGVAAEIEQFIPRVFQLAPCDRTALGKANSRLGVDAVCGSEIHDMVSTFRLCLGPMSYRQFVGLLPTGKNWESLVSLVRYIVGIEYEFEARLILTKEEVPVCRLGEVADGAPRLGWSTWIMSPGSTPASNPFITISL